MADLTLLPGELIGEQVKQQIITITKLLDQNVDLNVFHHGVIQQLKAGELTLDRVQIMADNQVKILPPKPATETKAKSSAKKNGKGATKDVPPLAEQPGEGQTENKVEV